ncbi:MAG: hypothetical protein S4CHLAM81_03350 [Chlamydiales bacterium]|nr:hypothetical protein [Chlamydiales bacterium]MCH9635125.1 hypothetical protein [Chlamydiales bacterium]MCH9703343.1 hypothetical protein [Chlamydiota bacterium]
MRGRFLIYGAVVALLPLFFGLFHFVQKRRQWQQVELSIQQVQLLHDSKQSRQAINELVRKKYSPSRQQILLELSRGAFLEQERKALDHLFSSRSFTGNEAAQRRYAYITGGDNRLDFVENASVDMEGVLESELSLLHSVEVDNTDIKKLLLTLEEREEGPHLILSNWRLKRRKTALGAEVYELNLKLLKREYHAS